MADKFHNNIKKAPTKGAFYLGGPSRQRLAPHRGILIIYCGAPCISSTDEKLFADTPIFRVSLIEPTVLVCEGKIKSTRKGCFLSWWSFTDSNCGPSGYEPDALTN